jgi:hypothetical protein
MVYLALIVAVAVLGTTAFYSVLRYGVMEGWLLLAHMVGSGLLVLVLPLIAIAWAEANRFGRATLADYQANDLADAQAADPPRATRFYWLARLTYWIILASGFVTASTMLASMLHWLDTDGLERMLDIHRYSGLLLVIATAFHLYGVWLRRVGWR